MYLFDRSKPVKVRLGEHNLHETNEDEQEIPIKRYYIHPDYAESKSKHSDIMLLELEHDARTSDMIRPACLYTKNDEDLVNVTVSGWGSEKYSEYNSRAKQ